MASNPLDLAGSTVLVTGASSGIGRETAILLSTLGARVILAGRNQAKLDEAMSSLEGGGHKVASFDLAALQEIPRWIAAMAADSGPLSGIVHAAGKQLTAPIRFLSPQQMDDLMKINVHSAAMLVKGFCQKGCRTAHGSIVFISSVMGLVGKPGIAIYCATKAALSGLTRSLALELAPDGIRVNCVAPGFVQTEMLDSLWESLPADQFAAIERAHPLGFGMPRDVANAVAFLLADTGRWITGSTLLLDGGYSAQ